MRREIVFGQPEYDQLRRHLLKRAPAEEAAVLLAGNSVSDSTVRLLVREVHPVPLEGFARRGELFLSLEPAWFGPLLKRCRREGWSFILTHSHPFASDAHFSSTDDAGEQELMPRLLSRAGDRPHGAIVFGLERVAARIWLRGNAAGVACADVKVRGSRARSVLGVRADGTKQTDERYARQVEAFGAPGHRRLQNTRITLVGLGGLGSHIYVQLKYLGVRHVTLVDVDRVELTNLNRLVYATGEDLGQPKVEVAVRRGREILPDSIDQAIQGDVRDARVALAIKDSDILVSATDTLSSRVVTDRLSTQYLIPYVDAGIDIDAPGGVLTAIGGRVMRFGPGSACAACVGVLNPARLSAELAPVGYVQGTAVSAPSVVSLNGVVASLVVNEVLDIITGFMGDVDPALPRSLTYDGRRGLVRSVRESPQPCGVCDLVYAAGDIERLPVTTTKEVAEPLEEPA